MKNAVASGNAIRAIRKSAVSVAWSLRTTITAEIPATISSPRTEGLIRLTPLKLADDQAAPNLTSRDYERPGGPTRKGGGAPGRGPANQGPNSRLPAASRRHYAAW